MSYTNLSNFNYTTIKIILENKFLPLGIDLGVFNYKYKDYKGELKQLINNKDSGEVNAK